MTDDERQRFHAAVIKLKQTVKEGNTQNDYDLHASLHTAKFSPEAHFGCCFASFHRIYLLIFEKMLQEVSGDTTVFVPYWASPLDSNLPEPCDSIFFTDDFAGPSHGPLKSGPFQGFLDQNGTVVTRDCLNDDSQGARPLKYKDLKWFSKYLNTYEDFCHCKSSKYELLHGLVHSFIDGIMGDIENSPRDPLFWLHHCFMDYLFEDFRLTKLSEQVRSTYPKISCLENNADGAEEPMFPFGTREKNDSVTGPKNLDGHLANYTTIHYVYAPIPSYSSGCDGPYLFVNPSKQTCSPKIRSNGLCSKELANLYAQTGINACYVGLCQLKDDEYRCREEPQRRQYG